MLCLGGLGSPLSVSLRGLNPLVLMEPLLVVGNRLLHESNLLLQIGATLTAGGLPAHCNRERGREDNYSDY